MILRGSPFIELTDEGKRKLFTEKELLQLVKDADTVSALNKIAAGTYNKKVLLSIQDKIAKITPVV